MADGIQRVNKTFSLPMGTRFVAGESTEGNTLYYSLAEKAYVVPTILESAHTMFLQGTRVITAPIALEGKDNSVLFKNNNPANEQQELGWAISSPMLSSVIIDELPTIYFNNALPFSVSKYFCFGFFGFLGYFIEIRPSSKAGVR